MACSSFIMPWRGRKLSQVILDLGTQGLQQLVLLVCLQEKIEGDEEAGLMKGGHTQHCSAVQGPVASPVLSCVCVCGSKPSSFACIGLIGVPAEFCHFFFKLELHHHSLYL